MQQIDELDRYRWKERLVVILSEDKQHPVAVRQLEALAGYEAQMKDRRLHLIHMVPGAISHDNAQWIKADPGIFTRYSRHSEPFQVLLIGLDGGVKLRRNEPVSPQFFFDLIDSMPMRQAEMRANRN